MKTPSSFWSRTYSVGRDSMTLRLYFGEVKVEELQTLAGEAGAEFDRVGVPHVSVLLTSNRAGMHFSNFLRMDAAAIEELREKLESFKWRAAAD